MHTLDMRNVCLQTKQHFFHIVNANGINLKLGLGMLNQLTSLENLLQVKRKGNSLLCIYDLLGVKLLTRLRL